MQYIAKIKASAAAKKANGTVLDLGDLNAKQVQFLKSTALYCGYGGARGGGKSHAVRIDAVRGALKYPGIKILIVRRRYTDLQGNYVEPLNKILPSTIAEYNSQLHQYYFINGSTIKLGHFQSYAQAADEYQGQEFDWIFMDEATQFTEQEFRLLGGCLRGVNSIPKKFRLTMNPGGVGHRWVKRLFIDRQFKTDCANPEENENPDDYEFIQALVTDNTALMKSNGGKQYLAMLSSLPENIRNAHRYGDWDALGGNYFPEFQTATHVCEPFVIPPSWARYRAFDYGLDALAVLWFAIAPNGRVYMYRELKKSGLIVSDAAQEILSNTGINEKIVTTYAPDDIWSRQKDTGKTMAEVFLSNGVAIVKASRSRVQGWLQVKEFLAPMGDGKPKLMVFNTCQNFIDDIQAIQASDKDPNDCATEPHDITHLLDSCRYFCISRTMAAKSDEDKPEPDEFETAEEDYESYMTGGKITNAYIFS